MFDVQLEIRDCHKGMDVLEPSDLDFDSVESMVMFLCDLLDEADCCHFFVKGFGDDNWPVDVHTDMSCFVEQLNAGILAIKNSLDFDLDFYEQGLQRRVNFTFENDAYNLNCVSGTDWKPSSEISMDAKAIEKKLVTFKSKLTNVALMKIPQLNDNNVFKSWKNETV